jgi:hypothetical protein
MQGRPDSETQYRNGFLPPPAVTGERSAVRPRTGESVRQSDPELRRPTPPSTAVRKSAARPSVQFLPTTDSKDDSRPRAAGLSQRKTGRGAGWNPAIQFRREAPGSLTQSAQSNSVPPYTLDDSHITALIQFFETLDRWDREAHSANSGTSEVNS